jgi:hypothetical protein
MRVLLFVVLVFALACGGGGGGFSRGPSGYVGIKEVVPVGVDSAYSGETSLTGFEQRTKITDFTDFEFYVRLFTGTTPPLADIIFADNNAIMIVHERTEEDYYFTVDSMTTDELGTSLTVYYYHSTSNLNINVGKRSYEFFYIPKAIGTVTYIEIVK